MSATGLGVAWSTLAAERPDLAEAGRALLYQFGVGLAFLGTIRKDGGPRVHPVCSLIAADAIYMLVTPSYKRQDLHRDPRYALHSYPCPTNEDAFYLGGEAKPSSRSSGAYTPLRLGMVTFGRWTPYGGPAGAGADATLTAAAT